MLVLINNIKDLNKELNDMPTSKGKFKIAVSLTLLISMLRQIGLSYRAWLFAKAWKNVEYY
jgi:hypothetical protein